MRSRIAKTIIIYAALSVLGFAAVLAVKYTGFGIPCVFRAVTGFKCCGCGNTTVLVRLAEGDVRGAFRANILFPLEYGYMLWIAAACTAGYIKNGSFPEHVKPEWVHYAVLSVLPVWWVVRNIINM